MRVAKAISVAGDRLHSDKLDPPNYASLRGAAGDQLSGVLRGGPSRPGFEVTGTDWPRSTGCSRSVVACPIRFRELQQGVIGKLGERHSDRRRDVTPRGARSTLIRTVAFYVMVS